MPRLLAYTGPAGSGWVAAARADDDDPAGRLRRLLSEVPVAGNPVPTSPAPAAANPLVPDAEWLATVSRARAAIHAGDLEKVVLARGVHLRGPRPFSAPGTLAALWDAYPSAFGFAISLGPPGCFLGATPELLVRTRGRRVSAQALAGTAPRGADPQADADLGQALLGCPKNRLEHSWVTRAIRDALSPLCETVHVPSSPRLLQLAGLQHLETPISGRLRAGIAGEQVAAALHPTPALGGWPQAEALAWIEREEQLARGWYAAPIGASTLDGESVFAVGIRSALLRGHDAWAFAGAGIVADSVPELELAETALKLRTVTGALRSEAP